MTSDPRPSRAAPSQLAAIASSLRTASALHNDRTTPSNPMPASGCFMIMSSLEQIVTKTVHDHAPARNVLSQGLRIEGYNGCRRAAGDSGGWVTAPAVIGARGPVPHGA